jgi:hypothetical protein
MTSDNNGMPDAGYRICVASGEISSAVCVWPLQKSPILLTLVDNN